MAKHFSELPAATLPLVGTEIIPLEEAGGTNKKCTVADVKGLTTTQIAFGDGSGLMTSSANYVIDNSGGAGLGKLGINTSTPTVPLNVIGASRFEVQEANDNFVIYSGADGVDIFRVNGDAKTFLFDENQTGYKIGIGTDNPTELLSVIGGNGIISGNLMVGSTSTPTVALDVVGDVNMSSSVAPTMNLTSTGDDELVTLNFNTPSYPQATSFVVNEASVKTDLNIIDGFSFNINLAGGSFYINSVATTVSSLSGTGTRLVTADASGVLSATLPTIQQSRVSVQFDKTSSTALSNVTGLTANLEAGKTYRFEATLYTTSNVGGGVQFAIAGTATAINIIYHSFPTNGQSGRGVSLGDVVSNNFIGVTDVTVNIKGTITVNTAGTLVPQFAQGTSNIAASSVLVGSTFVVTEMV